MYEIILAGFKFGDFPQNEKAIFTLFGVTILGLTVRQFELTLVVNTVVLTTNYVASTGVDRLP